MFKGSFVAIVTPFKNGKIDEKAYSDLIEFQIREGTQGIVPCGTTGESATLTHQEHERVIELTMEIVNKRIPVIAGTGSNSTSEAIMLTRHAKDAGADAALLITPYYNKPTQEGLYQHYKAIAESVNIPQFLYNVPGRTGVNMLSETVGRLSKVKNIIGIKEATGDMRQVSDVIALCGDNFIVLSGDDFTTFPLLTIGGMGVISVTANVAPRDVANMCNEFFKGNINRAKEFHYKMRQLNDAMFYETNPIPVKTALSLMGKVSGEMRLPLYQMSEKNLERLKGVMKGYGLI
ncbi:MAG: 4-hydroxy-tetrahydrodipicolinate synthase [Nitrospinae bacterium]|nr:4-hydroxy-tetrahydrodipicolinate synthase [Nitrospinota bacterium]